MSSTGIKVYKIMPNNLMEETRISFTLRPGTCTKVFICLINVSNGYVQFSYDIWLWLSVLR